MNISSFGRRWIQLADAVTALTTVLGAREALTASRTYYVRTDGSDSNTGLADSAGGAFLTIQKAMDVAAKTLDFRGFNVTVQVRAGTFVGNNRLTAPLVGNGTLFIIGDTAGVAAAVAGATAYTAITVTGGFYATNGAQFVVRGFKIGGTAAGEWSIYAYGPGSCITWSHINFGAVTGGGDHCFASDEGAWINDSSPYQITGGALNHNHVTEGGHGRIFAQAVQLLGTPAFTGQFAGVSSAADLFVVGVTYSGAATGRAYYVHLNGVIRAGLDTRNVFPGNANGLEETGGRLDNAPQFAANKNATNQVIANGGWVKVTMGTLGQQTGGDYSTVNSSWTPRGGACAISATVTFSAFNATNEICGVSIFKNGAEYKSALFNNVGTANPQSASVSIEEITTGGDIYELYARGGNTGNSTVSGAVAWTHWSGRQY